MREGKEGRAFFMSTWRRHKSSVSIESSLGLLAMNVGVMVATGSYRQLAANLLHYLIIYYRSSIFANLLILPGLCCDCVRQRRDWSDRGQYRHWSPAR